MYPRICNIPIPLTGAHIPIYSYGLMMLLGFFAGIYIARERARGESVDPSFIVDLAVVALISGIIGARIAYVIEFRHEFAENLLDVFKIYRGGLSFYGGLILATATAAWYIRRHKEDVLVVADIMMPSVAIGLAFGRIGCFLNGCCFGKITASAIGVTFPGNSYSGGTPAWTRHYELGHITFADAYSLPVHPTQIYHSIAALCLFFVLILYFRIRRRPGQVLLMFGALYSLIRFPIEFLRDDMPAAALELTAYQILAVPVFLGCTIGWMILQKKE